MKKYIVLSVNDNPEYLYYLPLTVWAWRKFGWEPIVFYYGKTGQFTHPISLAMDYCVIAEKKVFCDWLHLLKAIDFYRSDTIAQISRLYAACVADYGYLMTGDIDMIPLSDYWQPNLDEITVWGWDLTTYKHIPICYIGMPSSRWNEVMQLHSKDYNDRIKRDLDSLPNARSEDPVKRWVVDQDLITERLGGRKYPIRIVTRGMYANGYPIGRVDRSAWTLDHTCLIDCHLPRGMYSDEVTFNKVMELLTKVWPEESFQWLADYTTQFKKLL